MLIHKEGSIGRNNFYRRLVKQYRKLAIFSDNSQGDITHNASDTSKWTGFDHLQDYVHALFLDGWVDICWVPQLDIVSGKEYYRARLVVGPKKLHKDGLEHTPLPEIFLALKDAKGAGSPVKSQGCSGRGGMLQLPSANARVWGGREKTSPEEFLRTRGLVFGALTKSVNGSLSGRLSRQRGGVPFRSSKGPVLGRKAQWNGVVIGAVRAMRAAARRGR